MFRTGHRTDHIPAAEPTPEPAAKAQPTTDAAPVERAKTERPAVERSAADRTAAPVASTVRGATDAVLGRGVTFDGTLRFTGNVRIDGTFTGKILSGDALTIGEDANVNAEVSCDSISVHGTANGSLTAKSSIELHAPARVNAAVVAPSLVIDRGVVFDGNVQMRGGRAKGPPRAGGPSDHRA